MPQTSFWEKETIGGFGEFGQFLTMTKSEKVKAKGRSCLFGAVSIQGEKRGKGRKRLINDLEWAEEKGCARPRPGPGPKKMPSNRGHQSEWKSSLSFSTSPKRERENGEEAVVSV